MDCHINKDGNQALRQPWLRINNNGERVPYISTSARSFPYTTEAPPSSAGLCDTAGIEMVQPGDVAPQLPQHSNALTSKGYCCMRENTAAGPMMSPA